MGYSLTLSLQAGRCDSHIKTKRELDICLTRTACFHLPVTRSLDRTGRTPYRPQCSGRPLFVHYWEAAALGMNPNLLLRTESQHTSVDSDHSSAQHGKNQNLLNTSGVFHCRIAIVYLMATLTFHHPIPLKKGELLI